MNGPLKDLILGRPKSQYCPPGLKIFVQPQQIPMQSAKKLLKIFLEKKFWFLTLPICIESFTAYV